MRINPPNLPVRALALAFLMAALPTLPAQAQDGIGMRNILGAIGILPRVDRDPIEYRDRPTLVVPKDRAALRNPESAEAHTQNPAWPTDPDVLERRREQERRRAPAQQLLDRNQNTVDGTRVGMDEIRSGRAQRGTVMGESTLENDKSGVRLSPAEWSRQQQATQTGPTYAPGTEPPRQYLTDPPRGMRQAATGAPMRRTQEQPAGFDNNRPDDTWRRLD
ncbi:MAG: hypothetical protein ACRDBL_14410 [Rhabdaerophilum sp.]